MPCQRRVFFPIHPSYLSSDRIPPRLQLFCPDSGIFPPSSQYSPLSLSSSACNACLLGPLNCGLNNSSYDFSFIASGLPPSLEPRSPVPMQTLLRHQAVCGFVDPVPTFERHCLSSRFQSTEISDSVMHMCLLNWPERYVLQMERAPNIL